MKRFIIEDMSDVAVAMYDEIADNKKEDVTFVGFYDDAIALIKELIMYEEVMPYDIEISDIEICGYEKEYYVTLDEDYNVWCQPAYSKKHTYLSSVTDVLFIMNNCNSSILNVINAEETIEVAFYCDEECEDECCGECCCHSEPSDNSVTTRVAVDEDGNIRGFEKTWHTHENGMSYFSKYEHYTNDQELLRKLMDNFDIKNYN